MFLGGCPCCGKKECWRCYGKFNLPDNCGKLPDPCICDGKEYSLPDTFTGVLTYDSIEYNPASSLAESEVDFSQLQSLLDSGKSGMTFSRSSLVPPFNDFPSKWIFDNTPDGSLVPERCGDFGGDVSSYSSIDIGSCVGEAVPFFQGPGFSSPGAGQANYYTSVLPDSNGFGYCDWGVFDNTGKIAYSICDSEVLTITISGSSRAQIADCLDRLGVTQSNYAVYSLVNAKFTFTIPLIVDSQSGACCLPTGECSVTTHSECAEQCGTWTPDATCEDTPCIAVEAEAYQCFDAPPDEDGWTPVGKCHATEEECAENCPPFPCKEPCSAPFQVAGYAAKDNLRQFIRDSGATGDAYTYAPSITGWLNSTTNRVDDINNDGMSAFMESDVVQFGKSKAIRFSTEVIKKTSVEECQAAATKTIIDTPSITSLSSGQITIATQSLPSASDVAGTSAVVSVDIEFNDLNNPTRIMRIENIRFGGLDFKIDSSLTSVTFVPKSWCSKLFEPNGFSVFQLDQENWTDVPIKIDFYLADQSTPDTPQRSYFYNWYWPDSFVQPYCDPCESPDAPAPGGRTMPTSTTGPGTHLKNMLAAWGIHAKKGGGCKCRDWEVKMNRWGSDCRQHMDAIVDHLQAEAKKRNLPFVRKAGEMLVKRAIKRFEK